MVSSKHIRFPHSAITKSTSLLPMMYSISELCDELNVPRHLVRSWMQNGLPHQSDQKNRIWINGRKCNAWIDEIRQPQKRKKILKANQAYCFRCRQRVNIVQPKEVFENNNRRLTGTCPQCGCTVNKGVKSDQPKKLQINSGVSSVQKRN